MCRKKVPYHMEDLKLIDLRGASPQISELLLDQLSQHECHLRRLCLLNINQSEKSLDSLSRLVQKSQMLEELHLSWTEVKQTSFTNFTQQLVGNRQLRILNLEWNQLFEQ